MAFIDGCGEVFVVGVDCSVGGFSFSLFFFQLCC